MDSPLTPPFTLPFSISELSFSYHSWMVLAPFGLFILFYLTVSGVLYYHWIRYGMGSKTILFAEFVFFVGSIVFLYMALLGLSSLS